MFFTRPKNREFFRLKLKKTIRKLPSTLETLPSTLNNIPSTLDILPSTLDPRQKPTLNWTMHKTKEIIWGSAINNTFLFFYSSKPRGKYEFWYIEMGLGSVHEAFDVWTGSKMIYCFLDLRNLPCTRLSDGRDVAKEQATEIKGDKLWSLFEWPANTLLSL